MLSHGPLDGMFNTVCIFSSFENYLQKKKEAEDLAREQREFEEEEVMKEKRKEEAKRLAEKEAEKKKVTCLSLYSCHK